MRGFIKTLIVFVYLFLAIFVQPSSVFACESIVLNSSQQYYVSSPKSETQLINNKKEEYYTIIGTRNKSEISKPSNKNDNFGFGILDKTNVDYHISNNFIITNVTYPLRISHNISPNLKNAIYTRAP